MGREHFERLVFAHAWQAVLEAECAVVHARGVENFSQVTIRGIKGDLEFGFCRRCFANGFDLVLDVMRVEPFECVAAGAAFLISVNLEHDRRLKNFLRLACGLLHRRCDVGGEPREQLRLRGDECRVAVRLQWLAIDEGSCRSDPALGQGIEAPTGFDDRMAVA